jgi:3-methyladenine DNA glycosylase AlkD
MNGLKDILSKLDSMSDPAAAEGMARYGITATKVYGVTIPKLRELARGIGRDHELAGKLCDVDSRETRILAGMVAEPGKATEEEIDRWVGDFDSWEVCDQCCMNLIEKTGFAYEKAVEWSSHEEEFVRRAGFVMMARLAVSDKQADDKRFIAFLPLIKRRADDERNFVKKAVNWAIRQIGKRDMNLNRLSIRTAEDIQRMDSKAARWVAADALRELRSDAVQKRLKKA